MKMNTKEKILESLEGKRTEAVWELIHKSICKIYRKGTHREFSRARKEYLQKEGQVNDDDYRWLIVEQYNIDDGFYGRFYEDDVNTKGLPDFEGMFEDYFSDTENSTGWEQILIIDMKEKKSYLFDKKIKYTKKEVKIK